MRDSARRYYDLFRAFIDARLADLAQNLTREWPAFLRRSTGIAVLVVVTSHLIQARALATDRVVLGSIGISCVVAVALICVALQAWALWQMRVDSTQTRPYVVALLLSAVTIGVCAEAFAGLSLFLSRHGWLIVRSPAPSLWAAELYYYWHLVNSLPFLAVPKAVGWPEPLVFDGSLSGSLVIIFKIILIAPLVQTTLAGYELIEAHRLAMREKAYQRQLRQAKLPLAWRLDRDAWVLVAWMSIAIAALTVALIFLFDPTSGVNRWLAQYLDAGLNIRGVYIPLAWMRTAPQWLTIVVLIAIVVWIVDDLGISSEQRFRSLSGAVSGLIAYLGILGLLTLGGAALTLALLHVGLATTQPTVPPEAQVRAALNAYGWEIADAIPGLQIPETLRWSQPYRFIDRGSGVMLLAYKIAVIGVLVFPMARLVRAYAHRARPRRTPDPALAAAGEFLSVLHLVQSNLNDVERLCLENVQTKRRPFVLGAMSPRFSARTSLVSGRPMYRPTLGSVQNDSRVWLAVQRARQSLDQLEATLELVIALFGRGDVGARAETAVTAAFRRSKLLETPYLLIARPERFTADLSRTKAELENGTEQYANAAIAVLAKETSTVRAVAKEPQGIS